MVVKMFKMFLIVSVILFVNCDVCVGVLGFLIINMGCGCEMFGNVLVYYCISGV